MKRYKDSRLEVQGAKFEIDEERSLDSHLCPYGELW